MSSRAIETSEPNETMWTVLIAATLVFGLPATIAISGILAG
jgi:hypothetical protein